MAGININNLPQNLQQKLSPYLSIAKDLDSAIDMARQAGKWSEADDKAYNALNGGANWGKVMDEYSFDSSKAAEYKQEAQAAKANAKSEAKVYYADASKSNTQRRAELQKSIAENKAQGGVVGYAKAVGNAIQYHMTPAKDGVVEAGSPWAWAGALVLAVGTVALTSCKEDDVTEYNFKNENTNVINIYNNFEEAIAAFTARVEALLNEIKNNTALTTDFVSSLVNLQIEMNAKLDEIANNTKLTAQEVEHLKNEIKELQRQLEVANQRMLTIIANQEKSAKSAEEFYKNILAAVGNNTEALNFIVAQMTENNQTLKDIKELLEKNNDKQDEILKAVIECKYSIDQLPDDLKAKFEGFVKAILAGIADNGAKLSALANLLKVVNANMVAGHTAILNKLDKINEVLDALFARFDEFDAKTTAMLSAIAESIANMAAKIDKIDLDKIEKTLSQILDKIGYDKDKMDEITKLLTQINSNTVINGKTQQKILEAINKLDGDMVNQFAKLIEIGNKNNELAEKSNEVLAQILDAIQHFSPELKVDLSELIDTIKANGNDISSRLNKIYTIMTTFNGNINAILAKLDEILKAINDHEVNIKLTIDGKIVICDKDGNVIHEGEIDNLDWILG